jgi:3-phosphoglycerate kinase
MQAHQILSEVVQGGIVLETSVDEIQAAGKIDFISTTGGMLMLVTHS